MSDVSLTDFKIRIMPPSGDVKNGTMDRALDIVNGGTPLASLQVYLERQMRAYLELTGLKSKGFTTTVEEITE